MNENYYEALDCDEEVIKKISICEECGEDIFDNNAEIYVDDDGNIFCSLECALIYYGIHKSEDSLL